MEEKKVIEMLAQKEEEMNEILKVLHPEVDRRLVSFSGRNSDPSKQEIFNETEEFGIDMTIQANEDKQFMKECIVQDRVVNIIGREGIETIEGSRFNIIHEEVMKYMEYIEGNVGLDMPKNFRQLLEWSVRQQFDRELDEACEDILADMFFKETLKGMKHQFRKFLELNKVLKYMRDPKERLIERLVEKFMNSDEKERDKIVRELLLKHTVNMSMDEIIDKGEYFNGDPQKEAEDEMVRAASEYFAELVHDSESHEEVSGEFEKTAREVVERFDDRDVDKWHEKLG